MADIAELEYTQAGVGASPGYSARAVRKYAGDYMGVGVYDRGSFRVTWSAGLTVAISAGRAFIRGRTNVDQGMYRAYHGTTDTALTVTLPAAHATLPRIDRIILQVLDATEDAGASNKGQVVYVQGVATAGATLDNLNGAVDPATLSSPTHIILADVLVNANNSPALGASNIRDRRPFAIQGVVPPTRIDVDMVVLEPFAGMVTGRWKLLGSNHASRQSAALFYLPRRIAATHIRWHYQQDDTTAIASGQNYNIALMDASGRFMYQTGSTAFGGVVSTQRGEIIALNPAPPAGFMFEAGAWYVFMGVSAIPSAQAAHYTGVIHDDSGGANGYVPAAPNMFYRDTANGITVPQTVQLMADVWTLTVGSSNVPVPQIALSVG